MTVDDIVIGGLYEGPGGYRKRVVGLFHDPKLGRAVQFRVARRPTGPDKRNCLRVGALRAVSVGTFARWAERRVDALEGLSKSQPQDDEDGPMDASGPDDGETKH